MPGLKRDAGPGAADRGPNPCDLLTTLPVGRKPARLDDFVPDDIERMLSGPSERGCSMRLSLGAEVKHP
ncbi:hypothetical protein [Longimicrobium sp.]|uniref:hypothetical protein n=1 Tax=Longimicrobium sp. TaxID=2029185 RepID=UPI002F91D634